MVRRNSTQVGEEGKNRRKSLLATKMRAPTAVGRGERRACCVTPDLRYDNNNRKEITKKDRS